MKIQKKYDKYALYALENTFFPILEKIVKKEYEIKKIFVGRNRTYVAKIEIDGLDSVIKRMKYAGMLQRSLRKL